MPRQKREYEVVCDYCGSETPRVKGNIIYPHRPDLFDRDFYYCEPCKAWVGTHKGTYRPLGRLANAELRLWKVAAHAKFDLLWKVGGYDRSGAYRFLANLLQISLEECHIGMMSVEQCKKVVELVDQRLGKMPVEDI